MNVDQPADAKICRLRSLMHGVDVRSSAAGMAEWAEERNWQRPRAMMDLPALGLHHWRIFVQDAACTQV